MGKTRIVWGGLVGVLGTDYPEPDASGLRRHDRRVRGEAYATLLFRERAGFRASLQRHRRSSNVYGFDYEGTVFFAGIVAGWF